MKSLFFRDSVFFSRRSTAWSEWVPFRRTLGRRGGAKGSGSRLPVECSPRSRYTAEIRTDNRTALTGLPLPGEQLSLALGKTTLPLFSYPENRLSFISVARPCDRNPSPKHAKDDCPTETSLLVSANVVFPRTRSPFRRPFVKFSPRVGKQKTGDFFPRISHFNFENNLLFESFVSIIAVLFLILG